MAKKKEDDIYVDRDGQEVRDWDDAQGQPIMEGFFDYKDKMINPASENMKFSKKDAKNFIKNSFKLINRDLQLGNLSHFDYSVVFQHFHLGSELMRFDMYDAAMMFLQKGYTLIVMSNSRGGFQRRMESTQIAIRKLSSDTKKDDGWLKRVAPKRKLR